jgi:hypothetical protein
MSTRKRIKCSRRLETGVNRTLLDMLGFIAYDGKMKKATHLKEELVPHGVCALEEASTWNFTHHVHTTLYFVHATLHSALCILVLELQGCCIDTGAI